MSGVFLLDEEVMGIEHIDGKPHATRNVVCDKCGHKDRQRAPLVNGVNEMPAMSCPKCNAGAP